MKNFKKKSLLLLFMIPLLFISCNDDDNGFTPVIQVESKTYNLDEVGEFGISGTARFIKNSDATLSIELELQNTPAGGIHPAHIHLNTAAEGGDIALTLTPVNGTTGKSITTFTKMDNGSAITYQGLLDFDGYINVHLSADQLPTLVAQGDIGQNELTNISKVYELGSVAVPGISGTATFQQRVNGQALATIELENTPADGEHPAHIHFNTAAEGGGIAFTFNPVNGDTGISKTNVATLDGGTAFGYSDVLGYDGYINVHLSATDLATIVAQGDIGQNELTGEKVSFILNEKDVAGINGTVELAKRVNQSTLISIKLVGTPAAGSHPAHIHQNNAATSGPIVVSLNAINGSTGISKTQVSALDSGAALTYTDLLTINGYVNVHLSAADLATIVAQGNVGSNAKFAQISKK